MYSSRSAHYKDPSYTIFVASRVQLNTNFRTVAKNEFEKNLFILMQLIIKQRDFRQDHGECNHIDLLQLVTRWDGRYDVEAMIAKLNFHSRNVFSENLVAIEMRNSR